MRPPDLPTGSPVPGSPVAVARATLGLSQAQLADTLGVSERHLRRWEKGEHPTPRYLRLALLALTHGLRLTASTGDTPC